MICTSIAAVDFEEVLTILKNCSMAELRLDKLNFTDEQIQQIISASKVPLIVTYRPGAISEEERLEILKTAIDYGASYVDVEIESLPDFKREICKRAKGKCEVIISYHNYDITPVRYELESIVQQCFDNGADIAKLACQVNSKKEAAKIIGSVNTIVKEKGGLVGYNTDYITRVASVVLGAPFTFAAIGAHNSTAPGQLTADELKAVYGVLN